MWTNIYIFKERKFCRFLYIIIISASILIYHEDPFVFVSSVRFPSFAVLKLNIHKDL